MSITNKRELCAAIACYWLVGLLAYMIFDRTGFAYFVIRSLP